MIEGKDFRRFSELAKLSPMQVRVCQEAIAQPTADVLAGGAGGGGKSYLARALCIYLCLMLAGHGATSPIGKLTRSDGRLLRDNHALAFGLQWGQFGEVRQSKVFGTAFVFHDRRLGAILFRGAETAEAERGNEVNFTVADELTEISLENFSALRYSTRRPGKWNPFVGLCNPDGPYMSWVKDRWLPHLTGQDRRDALAMAAREAEVDPRSIRFVQVLPSDNPLWDDPQFRAAFMKGIADLPTAVREGRLKGIWTAPEGARFPGFSRARNVYRLEDRFPDGIPAEWPRILCHDYGIAVEFAALWSAVEPNGNIWFYRELYEKRVSATEQVRQVMKAAPEGDVYSAYRGDPAMWQEIQANFGKTGESVALVMQAMIAGDPRFKCGLSKGQRPLRIQQFGYLDNWLEADAATTLMFDFGMKNTISEFENAIHPRRVVDGGRSKGDIDPESKDHAMTAACYGHYGFTRPPQRVKAPTPQAALADAYARARKSELERMLQGRT